MENVIDRLGQNQAVLASELIIEINANKKSMMVEGENYILNKGGVLPSKRRKTRLVGYLEVNNEYINKSYTETGFSITTYWSSTTNTVWYKLHHSDIREAWTTDGVNQFDVGTIYIQSNTPNVMYYLQTMQRRNGLIEFQVGMQRNFISVPDNNKSYTRDRIHATILFFSRLF